jgi:hypothetical protein
MSVTMPTARPTTTEAKRIHASKWGSMEYAAAPMEVALPMNPVVTVFIWSALMLAVRLGEEVSYVR